MSNDFKSFLSSLDTDKVSVLTQRLFNKTNADSITADDFLGINLGFDSNGVKCSINFDIEPDKLACIFRSVDLRDSDGTGGGLTGNDGNASDYGEFSNDKVFVSDSVEFAKFDGRLSLPRTVDFGINNILVFSNIGEFFAFLWSFYG